jgi:Large polyvalent protein associated domain 29
MYVYTMNNHLEQLTVKDLATMKEVEKVKRIKKELKAKFPKTKFSVRKETASCMIGVEVTYEDGPKLEDVKAVTEKYNRKNYDGEWSSFGFVNVTRNHSDVARKWAQNIQEQIIGRPMNLNYDNYLQYNKVLNSTDLTGIFD